MGLLNDGGTYIILHSLLKFMFMDINGAVNGIHHVIGQIREHWWLGISHVLWILSAWGVYAESREEGFYAGDFGKYYNEERTRIKSYFVGKLIMRYQQELNFPRRRSFDEPLPQVDAANYVTLLLKSYLCQDNPDKDASLWKLFEDIYGLRSWELGWPRPNDEIYRQLEKSYQDGEITQEKKSRMIDEKWLELRQRLHQILPQRGQEGFILAELQASAPQQPLRIKSDTAETDSEQTRQAAVTSTNAEAAGYTKTENKTKLTMALGVAVAHNLMIEYGLAVMRKEKIEAEKAAQAFLTYLFAEGVANDCIVAEVSKIEIPQNTYAIAASEIDYVRNDLAEKLLRTNKFDGVFQARNQQEAEAMKANLPENSITLIFNRDTNKLLLFGPSIVVIDMDRDMAVALQNCLAIVTNV